MKSIFITAYEDNIVNALTNEANKYSSQLEIVGSAALNETSKQDCSFYQPDFIITGNIGYQEAKELLELCITTNVIIVSSDMNRANDVINRLQQEGNYRITAVDINNVSPKELCEEIINFNETPETDDMFNNVLSEEELLNSDEAKEQVEIKELNVSEKNNTNSENNEFDVFENPNDINSHIEIRDTVRQNTFNLNINNVRSKVISLFAKKGGPGKTTIAKEMCNVFSSVRLPKKLQNGNEHLKACVVDLDFGKGNLRTYLGIENPSPNIYYWINDILDRIENKTDIEKISYNQFQVNGYVKKIEGAGNYYALVTAQGGLPLRTMYRLENLDKKGDLLPKILSIIINSLKRAFDVVIIDCDSDFNEISKVALEKSDNILYIVNPTVADVENLKVFTDEISSVDTIDLNKVGIIINKFSKHVNFRNEMLDTLSLVKFKDINYATGEEIEKNYPLISDIPYDETIINLNNGYLFVTNNAVQETKKGILKACEFCLPIFKIKHTTAGLAELKKLHDKKKKLENKKIPKNSKEETIEKLKQMDSDESNENDIESINSNDNVEINDINQYFSSDLSNESFKNFIKTISSFEEIKKTKSGFPMLKKQPASLNKKVWKQYTKQLDKEIKISLKMKRQ